jgi:hypothetical protein
MSRILQTITATVIGFGALTGCMQTVGPLAGQKEAPNDKTTVEETVDDSPAPPNPKEAVPREAETPAPTKTDSTQRSLWDGFAGGAEDARTAPQAIERAFEFTQEDKTAPTVEPQPLVATGPGPIEPKTDTTAADDLNSKVRFRAFYGPSLSREAPREGDPALLFLRRDGALNLNLFCEKCAKNQPGDCEGEIGWYPCPKDGLVCLTFIPEDYPKTSFTQFTANVTATDGSKTAPNLTFEDLKVGRGKLILNDCNLLFGQTIGLFTATDSPDFRMLKDYVPPPDRITNPEVLKNPDVLREILQSAP